MQLDVDFVGDADVRAAVQALDAGLVGQLFSIQHLLHAFRVEVYVALAVAH